MIEQRRVHKIKVEGGILKRTRRWRHKLQGGANEAGHFMLYYLSYSLQISPNAEAIEGGKRKADMLVPYPSLILLIPFSHTESSAVVVRDRRAHLQCKN